MNSSRAFRLFSPPPHKNTSERKHCWLAFMNPKPDVLILTKPDLPFEKPINYQLLVNPLPVYI